jgi:hypothetical protein
VASGVISDFELSSRGWGGLIGDSGDVVLITDNSDFSIFSNTSTSKYYLVTTGPGSGSEKRRYQVWELE